VRRRRRTLGLPAEIVRPRRPAVLAALVRVLPRRVVVRGGSMVPTLHDGDVVLALPGARARDGAVGLVRWPSRPGQLSVKRLALDLGDGTWFAVGDAPAASTDSRRLGPALALAVVPCRLWPRPVRLRAR
jgi:Peptidase S24-like